MVCQAGISFDQNCVLLKTSRLTFNLEWRFCIVVAVCLCCAALRPRMSCKSKNLCIVVEVTSVRAVGGKSLISVVILVENSFRSSTGRLVVDFRFANTRTLEDSCVALPRDRPPRDGLSRMQKVRHLHYAAFFF